MSKLKSLRLTEDPTELNFTPDEETLMEQIKEKLTQEELHLLYQINFKVMKQTTANLIMELIDDYEMLYGEVVE